MTAISQLHVDLIARTAQFRDDMRQAGRRLDGFGKQALTQVKRLGTLGAAMTGVAAGAMAYVVRQNMAVIDSTAKAAKAAGMSTEAYQGLMHQAQLSGASQEEMARAIARANRSLGDAVTKGGEAAQWFEELGLSLQALQGLTPEQRFAAITDAIGGLDDRSRQAAAAAALLGDRQGNLLPLIDAGSEGIAEATQRLQDYGAAFSLVDAAQVEAANDAIVEAKAAWSGLATQLTVQLSPYIEAVAEQFAAAGKETGGFREQVSTAVEWGLEGAKLLVDGWMRLRVTGQALVALGAEIQTGFALIASEGYRWTTWLADEVGNITSWIAAEFATMGKGVGVTWAALQVPVAEFTAFVGRQLADMLHKMARAAGFFDADVQVALMEAGFAVGQSTGQMARDAQQNLGVARQEWRQAGDDATAAWAAIGTATGRTNADLERFTDDSLERGRREKAALDDLVGERVRLNAAFDATIAQIKAEARAKAESAALGPADTGEMHGPALPPGMAGDPFADLTGTKEDPLVLATQRQQGLLTAAWQQGLEARTRFQQMSLGQQTQHVFGQLEQMTRGVAQHNKALFRVNQVAGVANAIVNTAQGVTKALAAYPPPLSFAMAAAQAAAGAAQIMAIKNASFSGGGGGSAKAPSTVASSEQPAPTGGGVADSSNPHGPDGASRDRSQTVIVQGDSLSVERLEELYRDARERGYTIGEIRGA